MAGACLDGLLSECADRPQSWGLNLLVQIVSVRHAGLSYARFSTEGTMIREYAMYPHYMQPRAFRLMNEVRAALRPDACPAARLVCHCKSG